MNFLQDSDREVTKELMSLLDNPRTGLRNSSDTNKTRYAILDLLTTRQELAYEEGRRVMREEAKKLIGEHNARILNEYQLQEMGDERVLFPVIEKATKETLSDLITTLQAGSKEGEV